MNRFAFWIPGAVAAFIAVLVCGQATAPGNKQSDLQVTGSISDPVNGPVTIEDPSGLEVINGAEGVVILPDAWGTVCFDPLCTVYIRGRDDTDVVNVAAGTLTTDGALTVGGAARVNGTLKTAVIDGGVYYGDTVDVRAIVTNEAQFGFLDAGSIYVQDLAEIRTLSVTGNGTVTGTLDVSGYFSATNDGGINNLVATGAGTFDDLNVIDLATVVTLDAGVAYAADFRSPSGNVTFGTWLMDSDSAGPAVEDRNMMGPLYSTSVPGRFGEIACNWEAAGTAGTTGVVISIYNVTDASVLCTCTLGACTTAAFDPLRCTCAQPFLAGKVYVGRVTAATDCSANPTKIHCTVEMVR